MYECVRDLAETIGLPIPTEVIFEPPDEWKQHDLNGQTHRRTVQERYGRRCRHAKGQTLRRGQSPL